MKKYLKPSYVNVAGLLAGFVCVIFLMVLSHRAWGNHRFFNDWIVNAASAYGFDAFTVAMSLGAALVLVVSFIVRHILELRL